MAFFGFLISIIIVAFFVWYGMLILFPKKDFKWRAKEMQQLAAEYNLEYTESPNGPDDFVKRLLVGVVRGHSIVIKDFSSYNRGGRHLPKFYRKSTYIKIDQNHGDIYRGFWSGFYEVNKIKILLDLL
jgi:hypothetical protein